MPSLKDVEIKINAVKKTKQITKAMNMVAISRLRGAQDNMDRFRPYAGKFSEVLGSLAEKAGETGRTEFSKLHAPFTVKQGLVNTANTTLISPLIRLAASGTADLVSENLDFRVEPKFVGTLKGQGGTQEGSGLMVPVLVTGTFSSPKFRPDFERILKQKIERSLPDLQKQLLPGDGQKGEPQDIGEQIKGLLKGLGY